MVRIFKLLEMICRIVEFDAITSGMSSSELFNIVEANANKIHCSDEMDKAMNRNGHQKHRECSQLFQIDS